MLKANLVLNIALLRLRWQDLIGATIRGQCDAVLGSFRQAVASLQQETVLGELLGPHVDKPIHVQWNTGSILHAADVRITY